MKETKEKPSVIKIVDDFLSANDKETLIIKLVILVLILSSFLWLYYFNFFEGKYKEINEIIYKIKENDVIVQWQWNYKWIDSQINLLNNYYSVQEKVIKEKKKELSSKLNSTIPDETSNESVAKFFEELFLTISNKDDPVILNSVSLAWGIGQNINWNWKNISYKKHPINLNFSSSDKKFKQILDIIQISWSFDKKYYFKNKPLPIMTISSVNLSFMWNKEVNTEWLKSRSIQIYVYTFMEENKNKN